MSKKKQLPSKKRNEFEQLFQDVRNIDFRLVIKIGIGILLLYFPIRFGYPYVIGFIMGMGLMAYLVLFPSPFGHMILTKLFPHAFSQLKGVQEEHEKTEQKRTVTYKK